MAQGILVIADSGSGKSSSIKNLKSEETFIINIANKALPFKGWKKNYKTITKTNPEGNMANTSSAAGIIKAMKHVNDNMPHIKTIVIDDWQYMSAFEYFERSKEKGYDKFTDIATNIATVAKFPKQLREDLHVYFLTHAEEVDVNGVKKLKAKTVGKMIDNSLTLEGLFTVVLFGKIIFDENDQVKYVFQTKSQGFDTCKSPMGMFEDLYIPNDLQYVKDSILSYEND
jgi:hypothetical protein